MELGNHFHNKKGNRKALLQTLLILYKCKNKEEPRYPSSFPSPFVSDVPKQISDAAIERRVIRGFRPPLCQCLLIKETLSSLAVNSGFIIPP